jgi:hypothetical protein
LRVEHDERMDWLPIVATALGATIALMGTLLADRKRQRDQRDRDLRQESRLGAIEFSWALDGAHSALRGVARSDRSDVARFDAASEAVDEAGLFKARERLLVAADEEVVIAGEAAFQRLIAIRNVIREGSRLPSIEYHDAYHRFAEQLWKFRMTVREHAGNHPLAPSALSRSDWSERGSCARCRELGAH